MQRVTRCVSAVAVCCIVAVAAVPSDAQQPPPAAATQPASRPAAASQPATTQAARISLNFKDAPLDTVLDFLSSSAGFTILKDGPVDARVNIVSKQPVTPDEAITLVNAALKANGFTAIREDRLLRIVPREKAKKGNVPVRFGKKPDDIPNTDEIVTQVIPIENMNAVKLREDLKPVLPPEADVTANEGSNSIIITDASSNIRRIAQIISGLDAREASSSEIRTVVLKNANATAAVKLIETFFKGQPAAPPQNPNMPQQPGQPQPQQQGPDKRGNVVVSAADERTNTVVLKGSPETLTTIEEILKKLDGNPTPQSEMRAFPLKYAEAEATAKIINNLFKEARDDSVPFFILRMTGGDEKKTVKVNAVSDERTNTLLITGPSHAMAGVEKLIETLDANRAAPMELRVFPLKYADSYNVSKMLDDMFKPKEDTSGRFPFLIFSDTPQAPAKGVKIRFTYDDRTNSIIATAPTETLKVIERVIGQLDANPASEDTLFIYHLRNAQAANLEFVLNVLFGNINQPGQNPQGGPNQGGINRDDEARRLGNNNAAGGGDSVSSARDRFANRRQQQSAQNRLNRPGMPRVSAGIASAVNELTGRVFVVADPDTNSLIVTTASKYKKQVELIIDDLDRPVPQVLIKVLVAEVTHDNSADLGVDFSILNRRENGNGQSGGINFGNSLLSRGLVVSILEENLTATLHALAQDNKLDVLSRPYLLASDNQLASILIGQSVPFVDNVRISDSGQQTSDIIYRDIGLSLNVTPHINPDGVVILDVLPEISQLTSQTVPVSTTVEAPIIAKRSAESRIGVKDGQTIVIGGLMEDRKTSTVQKVPLLGDIPFLGQLLRRTQTTKTKTELLIFLTPHVAQQPEALAPMTAEERNNLKLTPGAVSPGTFQEHMDRLERPGPTTPPSTQRISPVNSIDLSDPARRQPPPPDAAPAQPAGTPPAGDPSTPPDAR